MHFVAIDIGTSFFKGAVVDVESMTLPYITRRPAPQPVAGGDSSLHELEPSVVVAGVRSLIAELATQADCRGVLLCGQMGGLVLSDENGGAISPYISWLDRRTVSPHPSGGGTYFDGFADRLGDGAAERLGREFRPNLPLPFLFWMNENNRVPPGAMPLTLPDYVAAALCGAMPVMEWTSATGSLDVRERRVPNDLLDRLGLGDVVWPELVDYRRVVGDVSVNGKNLPVYAAVGDHQCSLAGTMLARGELSINISTGSQVAGICDAPEPGDYQLRPYFDGAWLKTVTNIPAGRALNAVMHLLTELGGEESTSEEAWDAFFRKAEAVESSDVAVNLGLFPGAVAGPGFLGNLREDNITVGHVARAILETMAGYYHGFATRLFPNHDWARIAFCGGLAQKSPLLRQLILNRLGGPHRLSSFTEDALLGLGILGRVVSGLNATIAEACEQMRSSLNVPPDWS